MSMTPEEVRVIFREEIERVFQSMTHAVGNLDDYDTRESVSAGLEAVGKVVEAALFILPHGNDCALRENNRWLGCTCYLSNKGKPGA
jgi:hypothetical protein